MKFSQLPNILTVIRIIMVVPIAFTLLNEFYYETLILFFIAGLTDMLDGLIAKKFHFESYIGSILDPLADKILLISVFFLLYIIDLIPAWFVIIVILRDVIIISGVVGFYLNATSLTALKPSVISKINTFVQIIFALYVVAIQVFPNINNYILEGIIVTATTTILSGSDYIWQWLKRYYLHTH